jgi:hypothetical protein
MRLWINHETDGRGRGGSEFARAEIRWGSTKDSKLAGEIMVSWSKDDPAPHLYIKKGWEGIVIHEEEVK